MKTFPTPINIVDNESTTLSHPEQLCKIIPKYQDMFKYGQFIMGQIVLYGGTYNIIGTNNAADNLYQSYLCYTYWGNVYLIICNTGNWSYKTIS